MEQGNHPPIRGVIFDFGNVIYRFDNLRIATGLSALCGRPVAELADLVGRSQLPEDYEAGRLDSSAFLEGISNLLGFPFEREAFVRAFSDIFTPIDSTLELIRNLAPRYRLGLISNTNPWHYEQAIRTCPVFPLFDAVTLSHELKALKPDRRLYEDCLAQLGLEPGVCVFIDDRPEFVEGAVRLGMHGIPYTDPESLIGALSDLRVSLAASPRARSGLPAVSCD